MFHPHPYTKEPLEFKSQELIDFLSRLNPMMMRNFKKQYKVLISHLLK